MPSVVIMGIGAICCKLTEVCIGAFFGILNLFHLYVVPSVVIYLFLVLYVVASTFYVLVLSHCGR